MREEREIPELEKGEKEWFSGAGGFLADGHILFHRMVEKKAVVTGAGFSSWLEKGRLGAGAAGLLFLQCSAVMKAVFLCFPGSILLLFFCQFRIPPLFLSLSVAKNGKNADTSLNRLAIGRRRAMLTFIQTLDVWMNYLKKE